MVGDGLGLVDGTGVAGAADFGAGVAGAGLPLIATGGVRSGLDAAKAIALGATLVGVGRPLLQAALRGEQSVEQWISDFELELRTAVFLAGVRRVVDLPKAGLVITGASRQWVEQLGYRRAVLRQKRQRR